MAERSPSQRSVAPAPISGGETVRELLETRFPAFAGRGLREAHRLMRRSLSEGHAVFATLSGAMTPAGIGASCLIPLIESGAISCLTTTGANLYHDVHRLLGFVIHEVNPHGDDLEYRRERTIRIYDLGFSEETLFKTDRFFTELLLEEEFQRSMTSAELHYALGRRVAELEDRAGNPYPTILGACYRHEVPIFVGAPQDGSIFLNVTRERLVNPKFKFSLDVAKDVFQMAALQYMCQTDGEAAIWIFGGGVPKNYTLQGEPMLEQAFFVPARGFDIDVQVCVDVMDNGALSSCSAGEGHTWGKTSAECVESSSVYLRTDVTIALPFLVSALLSDRGLLREPLRLMGRLEEACERLDKVVPRERPPGFD